MPYRTTRNTIDGVVITFVNITVQHNAEQLFTQSLRYSLVAAIISDASGEIQIVNRQAEQMFGWSEKELRGRTVEELIPEERWEAHRHKREKYMQAPSPRLLGQAAPMTCMRKDGSLFETEIGLAPLYTEQGMLIMANFRDV